MATCVYAYNKIVLISLWWLSTQYVSDDWRSLPGATICEGKPKLDDILLLTKQKYFFNLHLFCYDQCFHLVFSYFKTLYSAKKRALCIWRLRELFRFWHIFNWGTCVPLKAHMLNRGDYLWKGKHFCLSLTRLPANQFIGVASDM